MFKTLILKKMYKQLLLKLDQNAKKRKKIIKYMQNNVKIFFLEADFANVK